MNKKNDNTFSIRLSDDWKNKLEVIATEQDRSLAYLVRKALDYKYKLSGDSA